MATSRLNRKPSFIWQAVMIILPVIILASFGLISLQQDKLLARKEAEERAQEIADQLLPRIWAELTNTNATQMHTFEVSSDGLLLSPPPVASFPEPRPFNLSLLNQTQLGLWQQIQAVDDDATADRRSPIETIRQFLNSNPPENFLAMATYRLGTLLQADGQKESALDCFLNILTHHPQAAGESGLPLAPLAEFHWLELTEFGASKPAYTNQGEIEVYPLVSTPSNSTFKPSFDSFCSNLVYHPSPLSPLLLERALKRYVPGTDFSDKIYPNTNHAWLALWHQHEEARSLYQKARPFLTTDRRLFWFRSGSEMWLAQTAPGRRRRKPRPETHVGAYMASCYEGAHVTRAISTIMSEYGKIPNYFGIDLRIADRPVVTPYSDLRVWKEELYGSKSGGQARKAFLSDSEVTAVAGNAARATLLASAMHSEAGLNPLKLDVYLTSPDTLFKQQTARSFWFGSLIAVSAVLALVGLLTAWRSFNAQQQLSEMKSNFVSSVSHELRAPIASVRLLAESLEKGKVHEPAKQVEYFRFIGQECRRLSGLIQNVLDFSRIDQGRKQYEFEPTDILALVKETAALMRTYADEREVTLRLDCEGHVDSQPLELSVDGRAIQQALINLIDNGIKHSPRGAEVVVGVEVRSQKPEPTDYENADDWGCRIWVQDHGAGIPASEHTKIFERFYRVGSELRRETQGVGIGLSIVKHVVEAHGGKVTVESAPAEGSTFTIELPRKSVKLE